MVLPTTACHQVVLFPLKRPGFLSCASQVRILPGHQVFFFTCKGFWIFQGASLADDVSIGAGARKKPDKQVGKLTRAGLAIPDPGGAATTSARLLRTFKTSEWPTWPSDHPY